MKFGILKPKKKNFIKYTYLLFIYVLEFWVYGVCGVTNTKFVNNGKMKFVQYIRY